MRKLGLDHPIEYFTEIATDTDAVIDFVGGRRAGRHGERVRVVHR